LVYAGQTEVRYFLNTPHTGVDKQA
jgi:hypothetical protein